MCGVAGFYTQGDPEVFELVRERTRDLFLGIQSRGRDAAGVAWYQDGERISLIKGPGPSRQLVTAEWKSVPSTARWVMLHTRNATKGSPMVNVNNHPVLYKHILLTHNGVIWNKGEVERELELKPEALVDSEAAAMALSKVTVAEAVSMLEGSFTLVWTDTRKPEPMRFVTNGGAPLWFGRTNVAGELCWFWASTKQHLEALGLDWLSLKPARTFALYTLTKKGITRRAIPLHVKKAEPSLLDLEDDPSQAEFDLDALDFKIAR